MTQDHQPRRLALLREERGLSRRELARRARVSVGTIHNIETGKFRPRGTTLRKVLAALRRAPKLPEVR